MEGIQTIQALKAVQSSLPAQTTIPSDELVMLYAADGTPIAKIARDDLVKAVASVMASNSQNTFSKLLGVQANGTPMGIGASDLASVLGECSVDLSRGQDINDTRRLGVLYVSNAGSLTTTLLHRPADLVEACVLKNITSNTQIIITTWSELKIYKRTYDGTWGKWYKVTGTAVEYAT